MNWTTEQLETFAKAGGWTWFYNKQKACWYVNSPDGSVAGSSRLSDRIALSCLPDFPNDIAACLEVLDVVAPTHQLAVVNGPCGPCAIEGRHHNVMLIIVAEDDWPEGCGISRPDAIIAAVLKAVSK